VAEQPLCLLTSDMQNRRIVNQHLAEAGAVAVPQVESNSTIALLAHVQTGRWASVVPTKLAGLVLAGGLVAVPIVEPEAEHLVGVVTARRDPLTPLLEAFLAEAARLGS
jgi:DNA-binding transcriptional LysR family regulator